MEPPARKGGGAGRKGEEVRGKSGGRKGRGLQVQWEVVADFGFEMTLTSYIPKLVKIGIKSLIDRLLENAGMTNQDIDLYAMHPGGKAILEAIESALEITKEDNKYSYEILRDYGNMSSCTVLFVLNEILKNTAELDKNKNILSCAFGPGLTLESMVLRVC